MIYTDMTRKAMKICFEAHKNQTDKAGMPYVFHPIHVAEQMDSEYTVAAALLHDTIEDTDMTLSKLAALGFPNEITEALRLLTHDKSVPYLEYIKAIKPNDIAQAVKLADLRHNSDLSRIENATDKDKKRCLKYAEAIEILKN